MNSSGTGTFRGFSHVSDLLQKFLRLSYSSECSCRYPCACCQSHPAYMNGTDFHTQQKQQHFAKVGPNLNWGHRVAGGWALTIWSKRALTKNLIFSWILDVAIMQFIIIHIFNVYLHLSVCSVLLRSFCVFAFVLQPWQCAPLQFVSYCLGVLFNLGFFGSYAWSRGCLHFGCARHPSISDFRLFLIRTEYIWNQPALENIEAWSRHQRVKFIWLASHLNWGHLVVGGWALTIWSKCALRTSYFH